MYDKDRLRICRESLSRVLNLVAHQVYELDRRIKPFWTSDPLGTLSVVPISISPIIITPSYPPVVHPTSSALHQALSFRSAPLKLSCRPLPFRSIPSGDSFCHEHPPICLGKKRLPETGVAVRRSTGFPSFVWSRATALHGMALHCIGLALRRIAG